MNPRARLSLNRVAKPQLPLVEFLRFTAELGMKLAEVRNDFTEKGVLDGLSDRELQGALAETGVQIASINALYPFEDAEQLASNVERLKGLLAEAKRVGCAHIVLCPLNDAKDRRSPSERSGDLVVALNAYGPLFAEAGVVGLIEPLGFEACSLRTKRAALDGIARCTHPGSYALLHDTFHHYLAGEKEFFPKQTALVHVSGVLAGKPKSAITDDDRILVTAEDIMDSRGQVATLLTGGCGAPISYEPFSPAVRAMSVPELKEAILRSAKFLLG
ncbi:MAG TPA: TIM barrel protein [Anaeromyxobacteraceae bacterium]|nr:TIM barrel protein [Anaeromyxobacteraceae bacterium]HUK66600.1 TIM barrel protein [Anaeromyxobacteraceae bacterium]